MFGFHMYGHGPACYPGASVHCCHHPYPAWPGPWAHWYPVPYCPTCCQPQHQCTCTCKTRVTVPEEVWLEPTAEAPTVSKEVFVGGLCDAKLTLEYMPVAGATEASVKISITADGSTTTWEETPVAEGFHVKSDFAAVAPGTRITMEANETIARLRWCEVIEC